MRPQQQRHRPRWGPVVVGAQRCASGLISGAGGDLKTARRCKICSRVATELSALGADPTERAFAGADASRIEQPDRTGPDRVPHRCKIKRLRSRRRVNARHLPSAAALRLQAKPPSANDSHPHSDSDSDSDPRARSTMLPVRPSTARSDEISGPAEIGRFGRSGNAARQVMASHEMIRSGRPGPADI